MAQSERCFSTQHSIMHANAAAAAWLAIRYHHRRLNAIVRWKAAFAIAHCEAKNCLLGSIVSCILKIHFFAVTLGKYVNYQNFLRYGICSNLMVAVGTFSRCAHSMT
jgi:hypothetical protein